MTILHPIVRIGVALSLYLDRSAELLVACAESFEGMPCGVLVRPHPALSIKAVMKDAGLARLPENFREDRSPSTTTFLQSIHYLVYMTTTVAIEALAAGVPVILYRSEHVIDMDNLYDFPEARTAVCGPTELRQAVFPVAGGRMTLAEFLAQLDADVREAP